MIRTEIAQAVVEGGRQALTRTVAAVGGVRIANAAFGDERDILTPRAKGFGQSAFRDAHAVGFGGVETIDAAVDRTMDRAEEVSFVDLAIGAADFPAAEPDGGYPQIAPAELPVFHSRPFPVSCAGPTVAGHIVRCDRDPYTNCPEV